MSILRIGLGPPTRPRPLGNVRVADTGRIQTRRRRAKHAQERHLCRPSCQACSGYAAHRRGLRRPPANAASAQSRLDAVATFVRHARSRLSDLVADARDEANSWEEIAAVLSISRPRVVATYALHARNRRQPLESRPGACTTRWPACGGARRARASWSAPPPQVPQGGGPDCRWGGVRRMLSVLAIAVVLATVGVVVAHRTSCHPGSLSCPVKMAPDDLDPEGPLPGRAAAA